MTLFSMNDSSVPNWMYASQSELEDALDGVVSLLHKVLPIFESEVQIAMVPIPSKLPDSIVNRGSITAKKGLSEIDQAINEWAADAELYQVGCSEQMGSYLLGPPIDLTGHLRDHGIWNFAYLSRSWAEVVHFTVPAIGSVKRCHSSFNSDNFLPLGQNWIDSDVACHIAVAKLGLTEADLQKRNSLFLCQLEPNVSSQADVPIWWKIRLILYDERENRLDTTLYLDAVGGKKYRIIKR